MKKLLAAAGLENTVSIESAALHTDEIGSDTHHGTRAELARNGIPFTRRAAWLLTREKAAKYDLIIGMDRLNMADLRRLLMPEDHSKARKLLSFAGIDRDVADPWYTGDFVQTFDDVMLGCTALLKELQSLPSA